MSKIALITSIELPDRPIEIVLDTRAIFAACCDYELLPLLYSIWSSGLRSRCLLVCISLLVLAASAQDWQSCKPERDSSFTDG